MSKAGPIATCSDTGCSFFAGGRIGRVAALRRGVPGGVAASAAGQVSLVSGAAAFAALVLFPFMAFEADHAAPPHGRMAQQSRSALRAHHRNRVRHGEMTSGEWTPAAQAILGPRATQLHNSAQREGNDKVPAQAVCPGSRPLGICVSLSRRAFALAGSPGRPRGPICSRTRSSSLGRSLCRPDRSFPAILGFGIPRVAMFASSPVDDKVCRG
jgi:hypothetical protein